MESAASGHRPSLPSIAVSYKDIYEKRLPVDRLELPERDKLPPTWKGLIGCAIGDVADPQEKVSAATGRVVRRREQLLAGVRQVLLAQWGCRKCLDDALGLAQESTRRAASDFLRMDRKTGLADVDCSELRAGAAALSAVVLGYETRASLLYGAAHGTGSSQGEQPVLSPANARAYAYAAARQAMGNLPVQARAGFMADVQANLAIALAARPGEEGLAVVVIEQVLTKVVNLASASVMADEEVQPGKDKALTGQATASS